MKMLDDSFGDWEPTFRPPPPPEPTWKFWLTMAIVSVVGLVFVFYALPRL